MNVENRFRVSRRGIYFYIFSENYYITFLRKNFIDKNSSSSMVDSRIINALLTSLMTGFYMLGTYVMKELIYRKYIWERLCKIKHMIILIKHCELSSRFRNCLGLLHITEWILANKPENMVFSWQIFWKLVIVYPKS